MATRPIVVIGMLGTKKDAGDGPARWKRWRPSVALCQQNDLAIARFELLHEARFADLAGSVAEDIRAASPRTEARLAELHLEDPWDFGRVYGTLHDFARGYSFDTDQEQYLIHVNTGTHVERICLFLLTESRHFPARLIQSVPPARAAERPTGGYHIIDLDLSTYDLIASRFSYEQRDALSFLKSGIDTRSERFNRLIERIEQVALASSAPILLTGPTGAGKSLLARRIFELKKARRLLPGKFVEVNSATLRGDAAMSALFGHTKGAFTGAVQARPGLLRAADKGLLFLDEIGDLGRDEQAMLLRALEEKTFLPVGSDREVTSAFQLIVGTNHDIAADVQAGRFREDLLARINVWTFALPGLRERPEDVAPNLDYELEQLTSKLGIHLTINKEARDRFLRFATSSAAAWRSNFRDLNAAVTRMGTLASGGRITVDIVEEEIERLCVAWRAADRARDGRFVEHLLGAERVADLDHFDRVQLEGVLRVCARARTLSEAGRTLFAASRKHKTSVNDANRLRKYLARFAIHWQDVVGAGVDALTP